MDALDDTQQDKLQQFKDFTSWKDSDTDLAINLLKSFDWNLEQALALHFDNPETAMDKAKSYVEPPLDEDEYPVSSYEESTPLNRDFDRNSGGDESESQTQEREQDTQSSGVLSFLQAIFKLPYNICNKVLSELVYLLYKLPFIPQFLTSPFDPEPLKLGPYGFLDLFKEKYGDLGINFYRNGSVRSAYELAKKELKYLVLIVEKDSNDLDSAFNRQILTDPRVTEFFIRNKARTIVWLGTIDHYPPVTSFLKPTSFPMVQLFAPTPKFNSAFNITMKLIWSSRSASQENYEGAVDFVNKIETHVESHEPLRITIQGDREQRDYEKQLREEQEKAYERSLAADRERESKLRADEEKRQLEEQERKAALLLEKEKAELEQQEKEQAAELTRQWRAWRFTQLGEEFTKPEGSAVRPARISIRTEEGERLIRNFGPEQTVDDIYAYVECLPIINGKEMIDAEKVREPEDYEHKYSFQLLTTHPRQTIEPTQTLISKDSRLFPSASLAVETEYSSDEEE